MINWLNTEVHGPGILHGIYMPRGVAWAMIALLVLVLCLIVAMMIRPAERAGGQPKPEQIGQKKDDGHGTGTKDDHHKEKKHSWWNDFCHWKPAIMFGWTLTGLLIVFTAVTAVTTAGWLIDYWNKQYALERAQNAPPITSWPFEMKWKLLDGQKAYTNGIREATLEATLVRIGPGVMVFETRDTEPGVYHTYTGYNDDRSLTHFKGVWAYVSEENRDVATNVLGKWEVEEVAQNTFSGTITTGEDGRFQGGRIAHFTLKPK